LFRNRSKKTDAHPEYTGKGIINGQVMMISAWVKQTEGKQDFMSLAFREPKEKTEDVSDVPYKPKPGQDAIDDMEKFGDVPW